MNLKITMLCLVLVGCFSCSNKYKLTQTPDDVYFSPVRGFDEETTKKTDRRYDDDHRSITMSRHDRRWRNFDDDYDFRYDPYHYGFNYGYYYNPYYYPYPVYYGVTVQNPRNSTPRTTNLSSYVFQNTYVPNPKSQQSTRFIPGRRYNFGNSDPNRRTILFPGSSSSGGNNGRSYSPSSSGGSSGGSIIRPGRN